MPGKLAEFDGASGPKWDRCVSRVNDDGVNDKRVVVISSNLSEELLLADAVKDSIGRVVYDRIVAAGRGGEPHRHRRQEAAHNRRL